jgi:hypothetical protein
VYSLCQDFSFGHRYHNFWHSWPWPWSLTYKSKPLTLSISFVSDTVFIFHMFSLLQYLSIGTIIFYLLALTLKFDLHFKSCNIGNIFWMVSDGDFVFHMHVPCDKTFILVPLILTSWPCNIRQIHKLFHCDTLTKTPVRTIRT